MFWKNLFISGAVLTAATAQGGQWYPETLYDEWQQNFRIDEVLYETQTDQQHLIIFENEMYGKVLALDGIIQITEKDEFVYSEMMAHVPLLAHGNAKKILIIGGGDGAILREVLKHKTVESAVLVDIDAGVIEFSKEYLPQISQGSFDNPRSTIIIDDGCAFVKSFEEKFDVIICDSTDPIGPGAVLFTSEFYKDCHDLLNEGGIFVNQNGVPFMQMDEVVDTYIKRGEHFQDAGYYLAPVPTYVGGFMTIGWATDNPDHRSVSVDVLNERLQNIEGELKYYTPAVHAASFALPKFVEDALSQ